MDLDHGQVIRVCAWEGPGDLLSYQILGSLPQPGWLGFKNAVELAEIMVPAALHLDSSQSSKATSFGCSVAPTVGSSSW